MARVNLNNRNRTTPSRGPENGKNGKNIFWPNCLLCDKLSSVGTEKVRKKIIIVKFPTVRPSNSAVHNYSMARLCIYDCQTFAQCCVPLYNGWAVYFWVFLYYTVMFPTVQLLDCVVFNWIMFEQCISNCPMVKKGISNCLTIIHCYVQLSDGS